MTPKQRAAAEVCARLANDVAVERGWAPVWTDARFIDGLETSSDDIAFRRFVERVSDVADRIRNGGDGMWADFYSFILRPADPLTDALKAKGLGDHAELVAAALREAGLKVVAQ